MPGESAPLGAPEARFMAPEEALPGDGAVCCAAAPPAAPPPSRLMPCALAKPVPAINAAAATEIKKRLVIGSSPHMSALPAEQRGELFDVPPYLKFHRLCFRQSHFDACSADECAMNRGAQCCRKQKGRLESRLFAVR